MEIRRDGSGGEVRMESVLSLRNSTHTTLRISSILSNHSHPFDRALWSALETSLVAHELVERETEFVRPNLPEIEKENAEGSEPARLPTGSE